MPVLVQADAQGLEHLVDGASLRQRLKRWWTLCHLPQRSGRSRHGAPVRITHSIPSKVVRWSFHRPPRPCLGS
ncbi:MAG: hypothetical protein K2Q09_03205, partial [Phycisphaerales bacterium]|nr:hypothetical protein [Phycisphaerales bacterium]